MFVAFRGHAAVLHDLVDRSNRELCRLVRDLPHHEVCSDVQLILPLIALYDSYLAEDPDVACVIVLKLHAARNNQS